MSEEMIDDVAVYRDERICVAIKGGTVEEARRTAELSVLAEDIRRAYHGY